ncbi:MAG: hypothetical protein IKK47_03090 [Ruminococcus sp.]|nr:hypothetical protein [Ruminococcus sp.]
MFWKKKKDGYEGYNGGDYIRPSEEYRADCEEYHEHGQTYSDYDSRINNEEYRIDCSEHTHGQTYSNYNSEQKVYDEHSTLERQFDSYLVGGEYVIWCGKSEKGATSKEKGAGGCLPIALIALLFFPPLGIFGLIVYLVSVAGIKSRVYAITNKSVLILKNKTLSRIPLIRIGRIIYNNSDRNIGYISFTTNMRDHKSSYDNATVSEGIFAIKDPERVATILRKAIADYR